MEALKCASCWFWKKDPEAPDGNASRFVRTQTGKLLPICSSCAGTISHYEAIVPFDEGLALYEIQQVMDQ